MSKMRRLLCAIACVLIGSARADSIANYQVLDWLESDGHQVIDTGIKYDNTTRLRTWLSTCNADKDAGAHIGAIDAASTAYDRFHFYCKSDKFEFWYGFDKQSVQFWSNDGFFHLYEMNRAAQTLVRDDVKKVENLSGNYHSTRDSHSTIWLFGRNGSSDDLKQYATVRMAETSIWQDGTLVRQLVPCKRLSDDELGMYDLVQNEFLTNVYAAADKKAFVGWAARTSLPAGYTQGKSIVVTDPNQYINTGYCPVLATDIEAHFAVKDFSAAMPLYWVRPKDSTTYPTFGFILPAGTTKAVRAYRMSPGGSSVTTTFDTLAKEIRLKTVYSNGVNTCQVNASTVNFAKNTIDYVDLPLCLFARNDGTASPTIVPGCATDVKLYAFTILHYRKVVKDFVPCKRDSDDVAGLFDLCEPDASKAFYANAGSGGSFGFEAIDLEKVTLTVCGSPVEVGTPAPAYGITNLEAGVAFTARMPQAAITNYLNAEERQLKGWSLRITRAGTSATTQSTDATRQICTFTPEKGDDITLTWNWTEGKYGPRTLPDAYEATEYFEFAMDDAWRYAFVNTDYIPDVNDRIAAVVELTANSATGYRCIFCSRESGTRSETNPHTVLFVHDGKLMFANGTGDYKDGLGAVAVNVQSAYAVSGRRLYQDGTALGTAFADSGQAMVAPLVLGSSYNGYDAEAQRVKDAYNSFQGRYYAFKVWSSDGTPRMDLRPCTRKADGWKGLYDTVRNRFCPYRRIPWVQVFGDPEQLNSPNPTYGYSDLDIHSGQPYKQSFTLTCPSEKVTAPGGEATYQVCGWVLRTKTPEGTDTTVTNDADHVSSLTVTPYFGDRYYLTWLFKFDYLKPAGPNMPQRYSEVAWIDFPGADATTGQTHIQTDYTPHPDKIKMRTKFQLKADHSSECIFCARSSGFNGCYSALAYPLEGLNYTGLQFRVNKEWATIRSEAPVETPLTLWSEKNTVWLAGDTSKIDVGTYDSKFTAAGGPLIFGAAYQIYGSNPPSGFSNWSTMRFFGSKIWENDVLVHDYRPCFDRVSGVSGLYDIVDQKFFGNAKGLHFAFGKKRSGFVVIVQ